MTKYEGEYRVKRTFQRMIALLLAVVLTGSLCPVVYAEDGSAVTGTDESVVMTEPVSTEETAPAEEPAPTEETEPTEEPVDGETAKEVEEGEAAEETPAELPYGLVGMPGDYVLSEAALAEKAALADVVAKLAGLTPGTNYVENEVMTTAGSEEEAALIAAAFSGEVKKYSHGMVTITLKGCSVLEAVTAAADMTLPLPAVYPNYITRFEPIYSTPSTTSMTWVPTERTWENWVMETMDNPDEYLWDPYWNTEDHWEYQGSGYQWHHDAVDTYGAWGVSAGENVTIAVIDSGVDAGHEDLGGRVHTQNIGCGTTPRGDHGTHVAGIIAAEWNNGVGGAGIAPEAEIISFCIADSYGDVSDSAIIDAIYAAVDSGAWIINMSFGSPYYNYYVQAAVNYAYSRGVTCIAAMGNDGTNALMYPAAYDHVIAVTATDRNNARAWFSSYGDWSDVSAPGTGIISTVPGGYDMMDGTSMAAPVVTGLAALYMSSVGWVSPDAMEKVLESSMVGGVVNGAKMFRADKSLPMYVIEASGGYYQLSDFVNNSIPCESILWLGEDVYDRSSVILYTTDGKTPSIKNGQVVNGTYYDWNGIYLSQYAGTTVTIKAARVTGMGVLSKALTLKLKVSESTQITGVSVEGPDMLVAGKTGTFTATVYPSDIAKQDVTWSIVESSSALKGATIDKNGKLKTVAGCEGYVVIRARSAADSRYYCDKTVWVESIKPVAKITVTAKTVRVAAGYSEIFYFDLWDANGNWIDPAVSGVEFVSSKPAVVEVGGESWKDGSGYIRGLKKGSATITIKALDGSGKSIKFSVSVTQPVESISISGQTAIAPGASATLKATAYPSTASNKKVIWELREAPAGVTISASGVVKVPSNAPNGGTIWVRAWAADGCGAYADYYVSIFYKSRTVQIKYDNYSGEDYRPVWGKDSITSVELYTVDRPDYMSYDESSIILWGYCDNGSVGRWTSSSDVVSIETAGCYCTVRAVKTGTAKLTYAAQDGSGKKATVTIKVVAPASYVSISTTAPRMTNELPYVAMGKSISFKATLGDTYGKPTNSKVTWGFSIYETYSDGEINYSSDWTDFFLSKKLCSIKNGKLTVKKGVQDYWENISFDFKAVVYCYDAYGNRASQEVYIIPPTTKITPREKTVYMPSDSSYVVYFESDQWNPGYDGWNNAFVATSSNPKVAGVKAILPVYDSYGDAIPGCYQIIFTSGKPGTKGRATITIKAADSGVSTKITVVVDDKYW